jgi:hypothetical protein
MRPERDSNRLPTLFAGVAHKRAELDTFCASTNCTVQPIVGPFKRNETGFGGAFGGLDIKLSDRIDFRAIQVDYNPVYTNSSFDHHTGIGARIVFK